MKNADMPAMPISLDLIMPACGESLPHDFPYGLTKREYFAGLAMQGLLASGKFQVDEEMIREALSAADQLLWQQEKDAEQ